MRKLHLAVLSAAMFAFGSYYTLPARADLIVQWTFETSQPAGTGTSISGIAPENNPVPVTASASGLHTASGTAYSTPSGNGSLHAFSANNWSTGNYYEFDADTTSFTGVTLTFDAVGSTTGPGAFKVQYATDVAHSSYTDLPSGAYTLLSSPTWVPTAASTSAAESYSFNLTALAGLNGFTGIRLVDTGSVAINGTTVATGGTSRVDNVTLTGTPVPEPASVAIIGAGAVFLIGRRRRAPR